MQISVQRTLRVAAAAFVITLAALGAGSGPVSVTLKPGSAYAYTRSQNGRHEESLTKLWVQEKALLLEFTSGSSKITRLVRPDGTLLINHSELNRSYAFFGRPFLGSPMTLPLQWASHSLLGSPSLDPTGKRMKWTDLTTDPRRDRHVTGDVVLDSEGKVRSLYWPSKQIPEGSLTISGWEDMGAGLAPKRLDEETQKGDLSLSVYWELSPEPPMPRSAEDFTFEGLLAGERQEGQNVISITDCRVSIESCPVFPYRLDRGGLVEQIGSAGHASLKSPNPNAAFFAVLLTLGAIAVAWAAGRLMKGSRQMDK